MIESMKEWVEKMLELVVLSLCMVHFLWNALHDSWSLPNPTPCTALWVLCGLGVRCFVVTRLMLVALRVRCSVCHTILGMR